MDGDSKGWVLSVSKVIKIQCMHKIISVHVIATFNLSSPKNINFGFLFFLYVISEGCAFIYILSICFVELAQKIKKHELAEKEKAKQSDSEVDEKDED